MVLFVCGQLLLVASLAFLLSVSVDNPLGAVGGAVLLVVVSNILDQITALGVCRTFQNIRLFANMTAIENVLVGMHTRVRAGLWDALVHTPRFRESERTLWGNGLALLERVGLAEAARKRVGTYSKGMRQRLGLAQALLGQPRALLLDEPTTGLDPALRQSFYEIVREMRDGGASVLLSSHALAELEGEVDRIVVMNLGRKMADGSIHDLRKLAGMSARVRIRVPEGRAVELAQFRDWTALPDRMLETRCDERRVLPLLRTLPDWAQDVEVLRPTLDEVYASFLGRGDQESSVQQREAA